jgi:hypothetical protein
MIACLTYRALLEAGDTISVMVILCPNCGARPHQGTNYAKLLAHAEVGSLECSCASCGHKWTPSIAEQCILVANLRKLMVQPQ